MINQWWTELDDTQAEIISGGTVVKDYNDDDYKGAPFNFLTIPGTGQDYGPNQVGHSTSNFNNSIVATGAPFVSNPP
jgi:hypothetical protein